MDFKFPNGFNEDSVLTQVNNEYMSSKDFVDSKRQLFKDRYDLYMNIADQKNKIYVRLIRSVMETLLSLYYQDKIKVNFTARHFEDAMQAENLQNLAEFDYEEMGFGHIVLPRLDKKIYELKFSISHQSMSDCTINTGTYNVKKFSIENKKATVSLEMYGTGNLLVKLNKFKPVKVQSLDKLLAIKSSNYDEFEKILDIKIKAEDVQGCEADIVITG